MIIGWDVPANETILDGTWRVGEDIQPGIYRTIPPEGLGGCYWQRLSGLGGEINDIIANDLTDSPAQVQIKASDYAFSSEDCGTWSKV